jgi:hypothetical protein
MLYERARLLQKKSGADKSVKSAPLFLGVNLIEEFFTGNNDFVFLMTLPFVARFSFPMMPAPAQRERV